MIDQNEKPVLEAISNIHTAMNDGFNAVYHKIDKKFTVCDERLKKVETIIAIKQALCNSQQEAKDFWKWIIRSVSVAGIISLFYIAVKLFIFGAKL